jgi:hypothetical protein
MTNKMSQLEKLTDSEIFTPKAVNIIRKYISRYAKNVRVTRVKGAIEITNKEVTEYGYLTDENRRALMFAGLGSMESTKTTRYVNIFDEDRRAFLNKIGVLYHGDVEVRNIKPIL